MPEQTVLEALLSNGMVIPNSCRSGACQSCMLVADKSSRAYLPAESQQPLTVAEREQGLFLACCTRPKGPISASLPGQQLHPTFAATVTDLQRLNSNVLRLRLQADVNYHAGQFANLSVVNAAGETLQRSYSIASIASDPHSLEFHIKLIEGGQFSGWLNSQAQVGSEVTIEGPHGHCYLTDDSLEKPNLLLAGIGTGLAPLWGILRDALERHYSGDIYLVLAAKNAKGFYLLPELAALAQQHTNLHLTLLAETAAEDGAWQQGNVYQFCENHLAIDFNRTAVYLCGAETFVSKMKRICFMKGTSMRNIFADAFVKS